MDKYPITDNRKLITGVKNITISGSIGTGTTTLGKALAEKLGWQSVESGEIFKEIHKDLGITEEEVLKRPDNLDIEFDNKMKQMLSEGIHQVIEGHLAGLNAKGIDGVFKIRLVCEEERVDRQDIRIARVARRDGKTIEQVKQEMSQREKGNVEKYERVYGSNPYTDSSLYDLTINTFGKSEEEVLGEVLERLELRG